MMKLSGSQCVFVSVLITAAGFLCVAETVDGANEFRRCYNTSVEMHCFDLQYDTSNRPLTTTNDNARQRCNNLSSTLIIIKDEETNNVINNYISDPSSPIRFQNVWTDAYRINDYNKSYTLHWLNSKLPTLAASEVGYNVYIYDGSFYTTTLECRSGNGQPQFYLTAKRPQDTYNYLCEYSVSRCPSNGSNVLQLSDRCYIPFSASHSWYEARNRCLKDGGDLASFANVTSINFTSWLGSAPYVRFWIGLRFSWYIWKDTGLETKFSKWYQNDDWKLLCLATCFNCGQSLSWAPNDCNNNIYVVCHSVTSLETTTITVPITTTPPETTSTDVKTTRAGNLQSSDPWSNSTKSGKSIESSQIALGVGVGVGVGVPVVVAIIVIVICVVRRHQSKKPEGSATIHDEETFPTDVHAGTSEGVEGSHYATIRSVSPPTPSMVENERTPETEYAILGFNKAVDSKNNNGHIPLDVL